MTVHHIRPVYLDDGCAEWRISTTMWDVGVPLWLTRTVTHHHHSVRAGLTIRKAWALSHTRTQDFLSRGALFFSQKVDNLFLVVAVVITFKPAYVLHVLTFSVVNFFGSWSGGGPSGGGAPSHGTTGTMDNPALHSVIRLQLTITAASNNEATWRISGKALSFTYELGLLFTVTWRVSRNPAYVLLYGRDKRYYNTLPRIPISHQ